MIDKGVNLDLAEKYYVRNIDDCEELRILRQYRESETGPIAEFIARDEFEPSAGGGSAGAGGGSAGAADSARALAAAPAVVSPVAGSSYADATTLDESPRKNPKKRLPNQVDRDLQEYQNRNPEGGRAPFVHPSQDPDESFHFFSKKDDKWLVKNLRTGEIMNIEKPDGKSGDASTR